tara:strand:+ start:461 stop:625 length:165 start_codon:yes stop_codon:yes gene_type:complete
MLPDSVSALPATNTSRPSSSRAFWYATGSGYIWAHASEVNYGVVTEYLLESLAS